MKQASSKVHSTAHLIVFYLSHVSVLLPWEFSPSCETAGCHDKLTHSDAKNLLAHCRQLEECYRPKVRGRQHILGRDS